MKKLYKIDHRYENCPMLKPTIISFFKSNKKYLFTYCDKNGEYNGIFYENEPPENIFIKSYEQGNNYSVLLERDFSKKISIDDTNSLLETLIFIDEDGEMED